MPEPKQVIVMRTDLGMRKGKMIAQGAHASMKVLLDSSLVKDIKCLCADNPITTVLHGQFKGAFATWLKGSFTKICVRADSEKQLLSLVHEASKAGLPVAVVVDAGKTEFNGVPTVTCCAIGPAYPEDIDPITGELKLL